MQSIAHILAAAAGIRSSGFVIIWLILCLDLWPREQVRTYLSKIILMIKFLAAFILFSQIAFSQQLPTVHSVSFKKDTFNIQQYGGRANGMTLNTKAIEKAIEACSENGGGTVLIPKGVWLTGPIVLKSNVNLHLSSGAVLQFSDNTDHYPLMKTNWEGLEAIRAHSPVYGVDLENIAITGKGIVDGAGQVWRPVKKSKLTTIEWKDLVASGGVLNEKGDMWYPTERALKGSLAKRPGAIAEGYTFEKADAIKEFLRPNMISLVRCRRVLLEGVTFQNSPAWCIHPLLTQHLTVRGIFVRNPWNAQNGDGIDVESCRYVLIENSQFDVGDDAICIKSGRDEEGRKRGVPTEDVIVRNCTVFHGHGGFVVGSEMSGGARNLFVYDCNFLGTDIGLRFKTTRGRGGIVEKVFVENIRMTNIGGAAILFDMFYMAKDPLTIFSDGEETPAITFEPVTEGTPQFRDIHIKNVVCKGAETAVFVRGLPEMNIKDIEIENISMQTRQGLICIEGDNITLRNATIDSDDKPVMRLQNSKNLTLDKIDYGPAEEALIHVAGERSQNIRLLNTVVAQPAKQITMGERVSKDAVIRR